MKNIIDYLNSKQVDDALNILQNYKQTKPNRLADYYGVFNTSETDDIEIENELRNLCEGINTNLDDIEL